MEKEKLKEISFKKLKMLGKLRDNGDKDNTDSNFISKEKSKAILAVFKDVK